MRKFNKQYCYEICVLCAAPIVLAERARHHTHTRSNSKMHNAFQFIVGALPFSMFNEKF